MIPNIIKVIRSDDLCVKKVVILDNGVKVPYEVKQPCFTHSRAILMLNDYVIKFDTPHKPYVGFQARDEYKRWTQLHKDDKQYFTEILHYDSTEGYVIQKREFFKRKAYTYEALSLVQSLIDKYDLVDVIAYYNMKKSKIVKTNWDMTKNGPVIYDYGI